MTDFRPDGAAIPAHVPAGLVHDYPMAFGMVTTRDPFAEIAPEIHATMPEIFYAPQAYVGGSAAWVMRRTADLRTVYFDTDHFSSKDFTPYPKLLGENWSSVPLEADPPMHGKYRSILNPLFTPKRMAAMEDKIRRYAADYIDRFADRGQCEFMTEFALEFPIKVFLELMGLPLDQTAQFLAWEKDLLHCDDLAQIAASTRAVVDYLRAEIDVRRDEPRDDLITRGLEARIDGTPMTDDELLGFAFNLFAGGLDTVSATLGLHFRHLAMDHAHQDLLRADPSAIPGAIEEMMRAFSAVTTFRTCVRETEIRGVRILPGDKVTMCTTLAGRDPDEFDDPDMVRFDRKPRHVSFAYGPHLCVGMHLARRELRIALEEFLARIPRFSIAPEAEIAFHLGQIQPTALPLVWRV